MRAAREQGRQPPEGVVGGQLAVEVAEQLGEVLAEVVGGHLAAVALQGEHRDLVGAGRPAQAQVDPARDAGRSAC